MSTSSPSSGRVRLASEYGCWPTWDDETGDNLDPADLGLPSDLVARLVAWDDRFQATFDDACPPDSRFPDADAEANWIAEGDVLFVALTEELGADRLTRRPG